MSMLRWTALAVLLAALPATAGTTWNVPGSGSNVCTTGDPNCNTIAQAVTASSNGDTILVGAGTFPLASPVVLTKTLTITGAGIGSTIVQPSGTAFSVRTSGIVISDLKIENGGVGVAFEAAASDDTEIARVHFSGQTSRGIEVGTSAPVTNVSIVDCTVATANIGLRMSSTSQVTGLAITGTAFTGNSYGIYQANDANTSTFSGLTIQSSSFTNNVNYAIYAEEMRNALIETSTFTGGGTAIGVIKFYASNGQALADITIRNNQFSGFKANAMDLEVRQFGLESPMTIEGNTIARDVSIATSRAAVFVRLHPTLPNAVVNILDNTITASGTFATVNATHGIQLRANGPVTMTGNVLDGGGVGGTETTPPSSGIFIESRSGSVIIPATATFSASCNRIEGFRNGVSVFDSFAGAYGGLQAGTSVTLSDNVIAGNDDGVVTGAAAPTIDAQNNYWGCPDGPTDAACDSAVGNVDADPFLSTPPACVGCDADAECDDGLFCTGAETCNAGTCVAGGGDPCLGGPDCENVCNEAADNCIVPASTVCRPAAGDCDVAETCTGLGGACPANSVAGAFVQCRAAVGECDAAENCDGITATCPADGRQPGGTSCSSDGNPCTLDQCDGSAVTCTHPAGNAGAVCRASAGVCDLSETCDGSSPACPADAKSTAVCRPAVGTCDVAESCNGVANTCPADGFAPSSTVCRPSANACDVAESCTGSSASCPADSGLPDADGDLVCDAIDNCDAVANPTQANGDGDALGDACDPCNNIVPTGTTKPKLTLTKLLAPANDDKLVFKGTFTNVPTSPTINPVANGIRVIISDSTGATPIDVTLPGGAYNSANKVGWQVNGPGTVWTYKNAGNPVPLVNGIQKVQLKQLPSPPGSYKFSVKGKNGNYVVNTANLPLVGTLVIDVPNATTGQCGEAMFPATPPAKPSCASVSAGKTVKCK